MAGIKGQKRPKATEETKKKISDWVKKHPIRYWAGKKLPLWMREKMKKGHIGTHRKYSLERNKKISETHKRRVLEGKNNLWKGGIMSANDKIRSSREYGIWRKAVFERDNYTCIWCGERGGELNADHIKPFSLYPELRLAIDNGRTLCRKCHLTTDTYGNRMGRYSA